ncbi:HK97 gp10 family phage protein [Mesobacillus foraminis]|uniref:HK97 gp10 family phage protein n=2 Tax=Mesobacillus foraminis TaxID=279826 RepID=A0A4R2BG60_9BACI|nr:HK97 gp10 family phage protein [Mesobacillus foraminis]
MNIQGLNDLVKNIQDYTTEKEDALSEVVKETALKIQVSAKQRAPVDSGHLKRNIVVQLNSEGTNAKIGTLGSDVKYAPHVEHGTKNTPAQPFLFPSFEEEKPEYLRKIADILGDVK